MRQLETHCAQLIRVTLSFINCSFLVEFKSYVAGNKGRCRVTMSACVKTSASDKQMIPNAAASELGDGALNIIGPL